MSRRGLDEQALASCGEREPVVGAAVGEAGEDRRADRELLGQVDRGGLAAEVCAAPVTATPPALQPVNAMLVRAPMPVPLRPRPDLKLPASASPEHRVTWLDTASRMPTDESAARVPDQAPPGETVNVVAASAGMRGARRPLPRMRARRAGLFCAS